MASSADANCACSNISIMQLFHELKQKFPAIPDHVVSECIRQNFHDRGTCESVLTRENQSYLLHSYPTALKMSEQENQLSGRLHSLALCEKCQLKNKDSSGSSNINPDQEGSINIRSERNLRQLCNNLDSAANIYCQIHDHEIGVNRVITQCTCSEQLCNNAVLGQSGSICRQSKDSSVSYLIGGSNYPVDQRNNNNCNNSAVVNHQHFSPHQPISRPTSLNVGITNLPNLPEVHSAPIVSNNFHPFLNIGSARTSPGDSFQLPIGRQLGPCDNFPQATSCPRTSESLDLLKQQLRKKELLHKELQREREKLRQLRLDVENMQQDLNSRMSNKKNLPALPTHHKIMELRKDIQKLREECQKMTLECDRSTDPQVPLGETNEEYYKNIYTAQEGYDLPRQEAPPTMPTPPDADGPSWTCTECTFHNHPLLDKCEQCEMPRLELAGGEMQDIHIHVTRHNYPARRILHSWVV